MLVREETIGGAVDREEYLVIQVPAHLFSKEKTALKNSLWILKITAMMKTTCIASEVKR